LLGEQVQKMSTVKCAPVDVYDVKADIEAVLASMGAPAKVQILRGGSDWWHPGRHGQICLGPKKVLGVFR
jgi:phenylalanyl-tRNA synthetase beta chain